MSITLADIQAARQALRDVIIATPLLPDERLTEVLGAPVYLKAENTQRGGSFKVRGAYNKMSRLAPAERARGVIAHSAGNHAQGVALAARLLDIPATIVMPERAPLPKIAATRRLGAEVLLHGATFDDAGAFARVVQEQRGLAYVHAFNDTQVIAGQGTIGLELVEALPEIALLVVPIGGGGLISGIAVAVRALIPSVRIVGVQAAGCASLPASLAAGEPVTVPSGRTIADGIAVKRPGDLTLPLIRTLVDEVVTVDDDEIARGIAHTVQNARLVVEGAGAAGVADAGTLKPAPRDGSCRGRHATRGEHAMPIVDAQIHVWGSGLPIDPLGFTLESQQGAITITCKEFLYDPRQCKGMVWVFVAEDGLSQDFWIEIAASGTGWVIRPARGCGIVPTVGVQQALDLVRDAALSD